MQTPAWVIEKERSRSRQARETVWLFGLHAVRDALLNPARDRLRLVLTRNAADRLGDAIAASGMTPEIVDPRRFDAAREGNRHLAFGAGAHQCLGLHLARLEMRILFEVLLDRLDSVELAGEPARAKSTFVGGLKRLPMRWKAA
jgi:tRNA G18 (ribose-2'-O)-methylase SpoU